MGDENLRFKEAIRILLWTLSAETQGRLGTVIIKVTSDPPCLDLNLTGRSAEATNLYTVINSYIRGAASLQIFNDANINLEKIAKETKDFPKSFDKDSGGLDKKKIPGAKKVCTENGKVLQDNLKKLKLIAPNVKKANDIVKSYKLADLLNFPYDEIGRKAAAENNRTPHLIFDKYYPDKKLTQQEFDAENKTKGKKTDKSKDSKKPVPTPATQTQPTTTTNPNPNPVPNTNITGQVVYGDSPFNNPGALGQPATFNTPVKGKNQDEDVFDDEENRGPIIRNVQDSNLLHQSSIKRQKYIKPMV